MIPLLLVLLAGCSHPAPPPVFASALPPARSEPAPPSVEPSPNDLPSDPVPLLRDDPAPGDGVLLSPREYALRRYDDEVLVPWLREQWGLERAARGSDRLICEGRVASDAGYTDDLRRDARALRWTALGLGAGGLLVGAAIGIAASSAADVLP